MKACAQNREALTLLAVGALETPETRALRAHVASCAGCHGYLREMERIAETLRAAKAPQQEMEPYPFLHRRVRHTLLMDRQRPGVSWRVAIPALAAMALIALVLPRIRTVVPLALRPVVTEREFDPTILNYQVAADQSLDNLDALLTEQGNRALPRMPIYRAGNLPNGNTTD